MGIDQVFDRKTVIDEALDHVLSVAVHEVADLDGVVGHRIEHLAIGFGEPVVVLEEVDVAVDVRHDRLLVDQVIGLHQIGIRRIGVDHHLVDLLQAPLVSLRELIEVHAEAPVRVAHREAAQRRQRVDLVAVDHLEDRLEGIEPVALGVAPDLVADPLRARE